MDQRPQHVTLKFLFASHDDVKVVLAFPLDTKVSELKQTLLKDWPAAVQPAEEGQIRLICMGMGILPNNKTLTECKVPVFEAHPTPINVAIRPKTAVAAAAAHEAGPVKAPGAATPASATSQADAGCCAVS